MNPFLFSSGDVPPPEMVGADRFAGSLAHDKSGGRSWDGDLDGVLHGALDD